SELSGGVLYAAIVGMFLGLLALFVFIKSNTSISITETASTGIFRSIQIQEGTGKFFYLSFMLISSSVVFVDYLFSRKHAWWIALLPTTVAMMALFVLGGRLRSLTAMTAKLLVFRAHKKNTKTSLSTIICLVSIAVLLPIVFAAGAAYRGGQGMEG